MSRRGILFTTRHVLRTGELIEVSIAWPAKLEHKIPLEILVTAKVLRCTAGKAAAMILWYDFLAGVGTDQVLYSGTPTMG